MKQALTLVACLSLASCDQIRSAVDPQPRSVAYQRFVPVPRQPETLTNVPWSGAFALDTKTGQLCLTYRSDVKEPWQSLPECVVLLKTYPDSTAPGAP